MTSFNDDEFGAVQQQRQVKSAYLTPGKYWIDLFPAELGGLFWWLGKTDGKSRLVRVQRYDDDLYFVRFDITVPLNPAPARKQPDGSTVYNSAEDERFPYAFPTIADGVEYVEEAPKPDGTRPVQIFSDYVKALSNRAVNAASDATSTVAKKVDKTVNTLIYGALAVAGIWAWRSAGRSD